MRGNDLKVCQGRCRLEMRNVIFSAQVLRHWHKLPGELGEG